MLGLLWAYQGFSVHQRGSLLSVSLTSDSSLDQGYSPRSQIHSGGDAAQWGASAGEGGTPGLSATGLREDRNLVKAPLPTLTELVSFPVLKRGSGGASNPIIGARSHLQLSEAYARI